jgi:hypothetical protein
LEKSGISSVAWNAFARASGDWRSRMMGKADSSSIMPVEAISVVTMRSRLECAIHTLLMNKKSGGTKSAS